MVATVVRITVAATTVGYFEDDANYYTKDAKEARDASRWYGAAAEALGLCNPARSKPVSPKQFERILQGYVPGTNTCLGRMRNGKLEHRPGVDLTFSAPKSVSLEALLRRGYQEKVIAAHDEAVRATLDWIERDLLETRSYDPETGRRPRVRAQGMVAATFRHLASREHDPQLHTHVVIANMTRGADSKWRSVEFTSLHRSQHRIGAFYRRELRQRLHKLGYSAVETMVGNVPGFEIKGYTREILRKFSKRRIQIENYVEKSREEYSAKLTRQASLATRNPEKKDIAVLLKDWEKQAAEVDLPDDRDVLVHGAPVLDDDPVRERGPGRKRDAGARRVLTLDAGRIEPSAEAREAVRRAVDHLEERHTVMRENLLHACAHGFATERLSADDLDKAIADQRRDGHLIETETRRGELGYVTDRAVKAEKEILAWMRGWRGQGRALATEEETEHRLDESEVKLNDDQREAARTVLLSNDRLVGVQGVAGSGKTTMLRAVVEAAGRDRVMCLAPSSGAAHLLGHETGTRARTLQWLLKRYRDVGDGTADPRLMEEAHRMLGGNLLIVDEASMIGNVQMRALMRIAEGAGVERLALVGDRRQLRAIEAGQPFSLLQKARMETAVMNKVVRQRNPALTEAVLQMIAGMPDRAIESLGSGVLDVDRDEMADAVAGIWLGLDEEQRAGTEILVPTHDLRAEIHARIRDEMAEEGRLRGRTLTVERFVSHRLTRAQRGDIRNWHEGDMAVFHSDARALRIHSGDACRITGFDEAVNRKSGKKEKRARLAHPDGKGRHVVPSEIYLDRFDLGETEEIELRAGDRIRWTRNDHDRKRGLVNGERAWIEAIDRNRVRFRSDDEGRRGYSLRRDDPQLRHIDHAWTRTVHGSQGMTCNAVIAVLDSDLGPLTEQAMLYVQMTRARDNVVLLTDDRIALAEALENRTAEELSALVAIGQFAEPPAPDITVSDLSLPWSQLVAWQTFAKKAEADGLESPFEAAGYMEKLQPILDLAEKPPDGLPPEVVRIAEEHGNFLSDRKRAEIEEMVGAIKACVERLEVLLDDTFGSGKTWTELDDYLPWRGDTEKALQTRDAIIADSARYGDHLDALAAGCASIEEDGRRLEGALAFEEKVNRTLDDWRELNARPVDTILFHREGYAEVLGAVRRLIDEEREMVPAELYRALKGDEERARQIRREREREAAGPVGGEPRVEDSVPVAPPVEPSPVEVPVEAVTTEMPAAPGGGDDLQADAAQVVADPVAVPTPEPAVPAPVAQDDGGVLAVTREYDMVSDALNKAIQETPEGTSWAHNPKVKKIMPRVFGLSHDDRLDPEHLALVVEAIREWKAELHREAMAQAEKYGTPSVKEDPLPPAEDAGERLPTLAEQQKEWARKGAELEREERERSPNFQPRRGGGISM